MRKTITALLLTAFIIASYVVPYAAASADAPAPTSTYTLQLKEGANYVSVPLSLEGSGPMESIFGDSLQKIQSIEYFDTASGKWQIFSPGLWGEQELQGLGDGTAFYIYARTATTITIYGRTSTFLVPALRAGWNSIGVAQSITVTEFAAKVAGFNPDYDTIYQLNEKGELVSLKLNDSMSPGTGYWLDNDPDGDGVSSSVELATYKSSPSAKDLVRDDQGQFTKKPEVTEKVPDGDNEKIAYLLKQCSQVYSASLLKTLDEFYAACKKFVDDNVEYTVAGPDEKLGGFTITHVRYKTDGNAKKIAAIGLLQTGNVPEKLASLFSLNKEEKVFLDLKEEKVLRAIGETLNGFTIGGTGGLSFDGNNAKLDLLTIDADGGLDIGLTAAVDNLPVRTYFVRWSPPRQEADKSKTNFIQLSLLLGDEDEPGDEVVASRVWYVKDEKVLVLASGDNKWLLDLPPSTGGVFEPYIAVGTGDNIQVAGAISPFEYSDPIMAGDETMGIQYQGLEGLPSAAMFRARKLTWLPASPAVSGDDIVFSGPVAGVRFMSALGVPGQADGDVMAVRSSTIEADEKGRLSVKKDSIGDLDLKIEYRFEKGAFVMRNPDIGLALYFEGWKRKPDKSGSAKKRLVRSWDPSVKIYWEHQSNDVLKDVSLAVPLSVQIGSVIATKVSARSGTAEMEADLKPRLLGFGWGLDGKMLLNFDGYETGVNVGIERKEKEVSNWDGVKKMLISALTSLQFPAVMGADFSVTFNARVKEQYIKSEPAAKGDPEAYQSRIELTGEGTYKIPTDIPLVGGSDLAAAFRGELQFKGKDNDKLKYLARTQVSLSMAEGADTSREEDGWRFSLDELRLELQDVEITGAGSQLEAIVKYIKPSSPKGGKRFTGTVSLNPPADFVAAGPFEGSVIIERLSEISEAVQKWRAAVSADIDTRLPLEGDDNYLLLRQLYGLKETGQNWNFGAVAELHLGDRVIAGDLFFQKGGVYTLVVNGYDLDDTFKAVDLMVDFKKAAGDKWKWSASLGGTISGKSLASLLGQDVQMVKEDFEVKGTYTGDMLMIGLANLPASWDGSLVPDWLTLDKVRNITYIRQKMADGTTEQSFAFDMDLIFPKFVDETKPKDKWPRVTVGATFSSRGFALRGSNLGTIDIGNENSLEIEEMSFAVAKDDPDAKKKAIVSGKARVTTPSSWRDLLAPVLKMPKEQTVVFEYGPAGFRGGIIYDKADKITVAKNISMKAKEFFISRMSPWGMGLRTELSVGGATFEGTIGVQDGKARLTLPPDMAITLPIAEGFVADLRNFNVELSGDFALAGDATLLIPEGNVMRKIVGDKLSAELSGSRTQYFISTKTNIYSSMDMGPLGNADYSITKLSLSSEGAFAGSGTLTIKGQKTDFVIGTKSGGIYFLADFGEKGIEAKLAQIFTLKLKNKLGLEAIGPYQYFRADNLTAGLGNALAGADMSTSKFLYFLPSSVPPLGFAFFDKLDGTAHIAGFGLHVGMGFPAPELKDMGKVVSVLGKALAGGTVDWKTLDTLSAPVFSLSDVSLNFPKVPGLAWKNGRIERTDNIFGSIFGKDKLEFVKTASLKPRDFVEMLKADTPMDVIKVAVPADKRKGSAKLNLLGFNTDVSYDLRSDELIYEKKSIQKLPGLYTFIDKVMDVDKNAGELPEELKKTGGTVSGATGITTDFTEIKAKHSGKCVDVSGVGTQDGANVHQWECVGADNQHWRLNPQGGDYYQIEVKHSGKCLDVAGFGTKDGANVFQYDCNGADNQKWKLIMQGGDYYQLQAKHSGKCLQVAGGFTNNGANVYQWACASVDYQKWLIPKGAGGSRSRTVDVVMSEKYGKAKAQVTWKVEDITADLMAIKDMVSAITPAPGARWQDHLPSVWNQFAQKGMSLNGNRAGFKYSPTITAELELTEYDGNLDITGLKFGNNTLNARFGTTTLYTEKNFEGKSWTITDDVTFNALQSSVIGNDNLSSIRIEGRGKVIAYEHGGYNGDATEITGTLDTFEDSKVKDNDVSSLKVYYGISLDRVSGWRLILKSDKGIVTTVDAGGVEVVFPGNSRALSLLPNGRLLKAIDDTKNVLEDLKPHPEINTNPAGFITSLWQKKVLPRKDFYLDYVADDDVEVSERPVEFKRADGSIIGFLPMEYGAYKKLAGLKFDKGSGTLSGKYGNVTLYEHDNFQGKGLKVEDDIPDLGQTEFGNDVASSIKVDEGALATLYSGIDYTERWHYDYTPLKAKHSSKCVDVEGGWGHGGANIHQWDCHGGYNQQWRLVPVGDGYFNLVARHSGKCADVFGYNRGNGGNIGQWECNGGDNQKWKMISRGGNNYALQAKHSGKCLDVAGAGTHNGANVQQWDCVNVGQQTWIIDLKKAGYLASAFDKDLGSLRSARIGNDTVRSVRVYYPLNIADVKEWKVIQSTPTAGNVVLAYVKGADDQYKPLISTELKGTGSNIQAYYDDSGKLSVTAYAGSGAEFPAADYRVYVKGTPYEMKDITEAGKYVRIVTKTIKFNDGATAMINMDGGISATYDTVALSPAEDATSTTVFTLPGPDGMTLRFNVTSTGGFGAAEIVGSNPVAYAPVYTDDSGVPQGIKKVVGKIEGGFFMDAALNLGTRQTAQVALHISGAIKTDGNYYLKGNGNLVIANFEVSEAVIELSSDKGLTIKGKMDLYGAKVDITGELKPNGEFSFTGTAQVMINKNGIKGALEVNNKGVNINGSVYLANKKIMNGNFAVKDGKVSWPTKVSIGSAGFNSTVAVALKDGAASFDGRAYINVDIPIYVWGPKGWKCKRKWGFKVCWPNGWGNIRVGTLGIHHNKTVKGSISGTAASIKLGIATLTVDVAKPSVKAKW